MQIMKRSPLVSIIIPIYNNERYLEKCLDSVLKQTYQEIEILLIDDGSTDNTPDICTDYVHKDQRFKYYRQDQKGVSSARNLGLSESKGAYITFIDSDDFVNENHIEILSSEMIHHDMTIVGYTEIGNKSKAWINGSNEILNKNGLIDSILRNTSVFSGPCNKMYKKKIIDEFQLSFYEDIKYGEDLVFNIEYSLKSDSGYIINQSTYTYLKHLEGATGKIQSVDKFKVRLTDLNALVICLFLLPDNYINEQEYFIKRIACSGSYYYRIAQNLNMSEFEIKSIKIQIDYYIKRYLSDAYYHRPTEVLDKLLMILNRYFPLIAKVIYAVARKE